VWVCACVRICVRVCVCVRVCACAIICVHEHQVPTSPQACSKCVHKKQVKELCLHPSSPATVHAVSFNPKVRGRSTLDLQMCTRGSTIWGD